MIAFNDKGSRDLGLTHIGGLAELESHLSIQDLGQHNGL
jgi:hypothetical protein